MNRPHHPLPGSVQEIADVIGVDAAMRLVERLPRAYGRHRSGQPLLYVPKTVRPGHPIAEIIGHDLAEKLSRAFGGETLWPASCVAVATAEAIAVRNAEIRRLGADGASVGAIALRVSLSERRVRAILSEVVPVGSERDAAQHPAHSAIAVGA